MLFLVNNYFKEIARIDITHEFQELGFKSWDDPNFINEFRSVFTCTKAYHGEWVFHAIATEETAQIAKIVYNTRQKKKGKLK